MSEKSIVDFGEISKPVEKLIDRVSEAVGGIAKPRQMKRVAKAEAEVEKIKKQNELDLSEMEETALRRRIQEEAKDQANIEAITAKASEYVSDSANPDDMDEDWLRFFFDRSRLVSDKEMQQIWSKVLAGEANEPGSFSPVTVDIVSKMQKRDAQTFSRIGSFCWEFRERTQIFIFTSLLNDDDIAFFEPFDLDRIVALGLVEHFPADMSFSVEDDEVTLRYFDKYAKCILMGEPRELPVGRLDLLPPGTELIGLAAPQPHINIFRKTIEAWKGFGLQVEERPND